MKNEFVPYQELLALKELGFSNGDWFSAYTPAWWFKQDKDTEAELRERRWFENDVWNSSYIPAPLYQQAFRWFREKHGIGGYVRRGSIKMHEHLKENGFVVADYEWRINKTDGTHTWGHGMEDTYEEAELACLRKLIEIVKEKRDDNT